MSESIHVAGAKTSRNMPHVISRLRESVLCESIHVAGAKTSRNMPIHDETGLLAQFNARANQCAWESILSDIDADPFLSPFHSAKNREHVRIDPLWNRMNSYDGNDHIRRIRLSLKGIHFVCQCTFRLHRERRKPPNARGANMRAINAHVIAM